MSAPDPTPARVRFLTAGLLLGTFTAGAAFGAGLLVAVGPRPPPGTHGFGAGPPPPPGPLPLGDLGLSPAQDQEARKILERHRPALEAILRDSFPRVRVENEAIEREIRLILTDAQRQRLDQIEAARPLVHPREPREAKSCRSPATSTTRTRCSHRQGKCSTCPATDRRPLAVAPRGRVARHHRLTCSPAATTKRASSASEKPL